MLVGLAQVDSQPLDMSSGACLNGFNAGGVEGHAGKHDIRGMHRYVAQCIAGINPGPAAEYRLRAKCGNYALSGSVWRPERTEPT